MIKIVFSKISFHQQNFLEIVSMGQHRKIFKNLRSEKSIFYRKFFSQYYFLKKRINGVTQERFKEKN